MAIRIGLVAASRRQRGTICQARDQFDPSPVFRRARDFCERVHPEWFILTGKPALLSPVQVTGPHPVAHALAPAERACWSAALAQTLRERRDYSAEPVVFVLYASQLYADALQRAAPELQFELPLSGLSLGQRLRWYDQQLHARSRLLFLRADT